LLAGGVSVELQRRVRELQADLDLIGKLEDIRLQEASVKNDRFNIAQSDAAYAQVFRAYGLDLDKLDATKVAERLRSKACAATLAASLDHWAWVCKATRKKEDTTWIELLTIARAADPDPWRNQIRDSLERQDPAALIQLAAVEQTSVQPPASLVLLGNSLQQAGLLKEAVAVLSKAQRYHPGDFWINHNLAYALAQIGRLDQAVRFYTAALAIHAYSPGAQNNLGLALWKQRAFDEAIAAYRQAIQLKSDYAMAYTNLGLALLDKGTQDEAIAACKEGVRLNPISAWAFCNLGIAMQAKGALDEAIAAHKQAIRLKPYYAAAYNDLGLAIRAKGALEDAIAAHKKAIRLKPAFAMAYTNLGIALREKGALEEAIIACKEGVRLDPGSARALTNLGLVLRDNGAIEEAIAAHREAIRLKPDYAEAYHDLGLALWAKGALDETIAAYKEAIRIKPDFAEAICNLGCALAEKGQFREALEALRRGHQLGSQNPRWRYPSARRVQECERLIELDSRLPAVMGGETILASAAENIDFANLCRRKHLYVAAARFSLQALTAQPDLADDLEHWHRYNAACYAALAGCGKGEDAAALNESQRASWRRQALDWLRADLAHWTKQAASSSPQAASTVRRELAHWQRDPDLSGVRSAKALAALPEAERDAWDKLWKDVESTLAKARATAAPTEKSQQKPPS
jgi:tetratricopeptide (TPR) repeat protein